MFCIVTGLKQLNFSQLMEVYTESNLRTAAGQYPALPQGLALMQAEQDFYQYLGQSFFPEGGFYCIWGQPRYLAALRMERYEDGFLLTALETHPERRNEGIGKLLVQQSLEYCKANYGCPVYSHVEKTNAASMAVHRRCGFTLHRSWAVYLDGSVSHRCNTMIWKDAPA